jgi:ATP-binding cassette, subfamily F, member 3
MALLTAADLHKDVAGQPLLRGVSFKLERRDRMTLAGRNGAGKTTLLRMLAGESAIDRGELSVAKGARVALHDQRPPRDRDRTLRDYVLSGCCAELEVEAQLVELERAMAAGDGDEPTLARYARAQARLEAHGGYLWRDRAVVMARGLGFGEQDLDRALHTFSGGELTRASLARVLATGADVVLLDEPTNHLDIDSLEWLEQTLVALDAAVVLVAHDRWFLEAVGTAVLEIEATRARFFAGSWHRWRRERAAREIALGKAIDRQRAEIARMERFIERFRYKATKARQAQSRLKRLARTERIEREPDSGRALQFQFATPARSGRVVFELSDGRVEVGGDRDGDDGGERRRGAGGSARARDGAAAGERPSGRPITLVDHAQLWLERGEHVSLVGANGSGKTTLAQVLAGRRPLAAGKLSRGHNVQVGYLSQHSEELGADGPVGQTVLEATQRATKLTPNRARALLGRFLFSREEADKPLTGLSGGERRRLALAVLVASEANVLILDEPTNHLDIDSREALEDALRGFPGAILLISHDRALLDAVGTRTIAVEDAALHSYAGGWPEYSRVREARAQERSSKPRAPGAGVARAPDAPANAPRGAPSSPSAAAAADRAGGPDGATARRALAAASKRPGARSAGPSKNRLAAQRRAEQAIEDAEAALGQLEDELGDPQAWATPYEAAKSEARHTAARRTVEAAYARLEELQD